MHKIRAAAEVRSGQVPKASGEDNTGRVTTKGEDHQNKSAAVRKPNRLWWLLPAVGLLAILAGWIGIQRRAGRLPVEPMGTPTEMILGVERSQTEMAMTDVSVEFGPLTETGIFPEPFKTATKMQTLQNFQIVLPQEAEEGIMTIHPQARMKYMEKKRIWKLRRRK